jgi:Uma2 family endonuclease
VSIAIHKKLYTFEEFCDLIPEGEKADLIDGVIYMASPDSIEHHDLYGWLYRLICDYLEEMKMLGRLFGSRVAFRLGRSHGPEPDLGYVAAEHLDRIRRGYVIGRPIGPPRLSRRTASSAITCASAGSLNAPACWNTGSSIRCVKK